MIRMICGAAAITTAGAASAADIPRLSYATPYMASAYGWTGPYLGGQLGYQWGNPNPAQPSGIAGGVRGGYNWQSGGLVFGGEAELNLSAAQDRFAAWKFSNPWFGTVRGRVGYAFSNVLVYGTLGLAVGGGRVELGGASESQNPHRLDRGRRHGGRPHRRLVGAGRIPLRRSVRPALWADRRQPRLRVSLLRIGVNYRF